MKKMDELNIGGGGTSMGGNPMRSIADEQIQP